MDSDLFNSRLHIGDSDGTAAATAASKQITVHSSGSTTCVLVNSNTIANGIVATVALTISPSTLDTSSTVQLTMALQLLLIALPDDHSHWQW